MKPLGQMSVLVVGLGQIGGSMAIDLKRKRIVAKVSGYDRDSSVTRAALRRKVIDSAVYSLPAGVASADLVILATPIRETIRMIPRISRYLLPDAAICDVAGTKCEIMRVLDALPRKVQYVSVHPIAGSEKIGLDGAEALFRWRQSPDVRELFF